MYPNTSAVFSILTSLMEKKKLVLVTLLAAVKQAPRISHNHKILFCEISIPKDYARNCAISCSVQVQADASFHSLRLRNCHNFSLFRCIHVAGTLRTLLQMQRRDSEKSIVPTMSANCCRVNRASVWYASKSICINVKPMQ